MLVHSCSATCSLPACSCTGKDVSSLLGHAWLLLSNLEWSCSGQLLLPPHAWGPALGGASLPAAAHCFQCLHLSSRPCRPPQSSGLLGGWPRRRSCLRAEPWRRLCGALGCSACSQWPELHCLVCLERFSCGWGDLQECLRFHGWRSFACLTPLLACRNAERYRAGSCSRASLPGSCGRAPTSSSFGIMRKQSWNW